MYKLTALGCVDLWDCCIDPNSLIRQRHLG
jgi:hypothetical protein